MAPAGKVSGFYREADDWFCNATLPSDITVVVEGVSFHLHKFPLVSKCGKIARICEDHRSTHEKIFTAVLEGFPGGPDSFLIAVKFCYGFQVEFTSRNIVMVCCAADYLEMTDEFGEDNLLSKSEGFFHKNVLRNWKDCVLALQSCESCLQRAEDLQIVDECLNALSVMACTDASLFGWPMMMYGSRQSPGGSILWNGISTGAKIPTSASDWWFEDVSYFSIGMFEKLINTMKKRGIRSENITGAIIYYARKYLPGLGRWQSGQGSKTRTVASFSLNPATVDQKVLLEVTVKLLPEKKGKSFCRFLLGLLRVASIIGVNEACRDSLERKIGMQLELATLDGLLIPSYSDSDALYNTDCVERIVRHFTQSESELTTFSPPSVDLETSPSTQLIRKVAKLVDSYVAEVASDVNLKPGKIRALAESLPEYSRSLHDGLYRALDIYFKAHPWLSEREREELCNIIDYHKLSVDACAHASQNERLPLRVVLQVLFFEQIHLRTALAGCFNVLDTEAAPAGDVRARSQTAGQIVQRDGWVAVVRENQALKGDMEKMTSRVGELEQEFSKIKQEMRRVSKSHSTLSSPRAISGKTGCRLLPQSPNARKESTVTTPKAAVEGGRHSHSCQARHRKSFSFSFF